MSKQKDKSASVTAVRGFYQNESFYYQRSTLQFLSPGSEYRYWTETQRLRSDSSPILAVAVLICLFSLYSCGGLCVPRLAVTLASLLAALGLSWMRLVGARVRDTLVCFAYYLAVWDTELVDGGFVLFFPRFAIRKIHLELLYGTYWAEFLFLALIDAAVIALVKTPGVYQFLPALFPFVTLLYLAESRYRQLWKHADSFRKSEVQAFDLFQNSTSSQFVVDGQGKIVEVNAEGQGFAAMKGVKNPWKLALAGLFPSRYHERLTEMLACAIKGESQREEFLLRDSEVELMDEVRNKGEFKGLAILIQTEPVKWGDRNCVKVQCLDLSSYITRRLLVVSELQTLHHYVSTVEKAFDRAYQSSEGLTLVDLWHFHTLVFLVRSAMTLQRHFVGVIDLIEEGFDMRQETMNLVEASSVPGVEKGLNVTLIHDTGLPQSCFGDHIKCAQVFKSICDFAFDHASQHSDISIMCRVDGASDTTVNINFRFTFVSNKLTGPDVKALFMKPKASLSLEQISKIISDYGTGLAVAGILIETLGGYVADAYVQDSTACKILISYIIPLKPCSSPIEKQSKIFFPSEYREILDANTIKWRFQERKFKRMSSNLLRSEDYVEKPGIQCRGNGQKFQSLEEKQVKDTRMSLKRLIDVHTGQRREPLASILRSTEVRFDTEFSENGLDEKVVSMEDSVVTALHRTLQRHASNLKLVNTPDLRLGTTANLRVTYDDDQLRARRRHSFNVLGQNPSPHGLSQKTLLVEYNIFYKESLVSLLQQLFILTPDFANNGIEALGLHNSAANKGERYPLILVDVIMPDMDGFELTRKIRAREDILNLPRSAIIGLCATPDSEKKRLGEEAGMDDVCKVYLVSKADSEEELVRFLLNREDVIHIE